MHLTLAIPLNPFGSVYSSCLGLKERERLMSGWLTSSIQRGNIARMPYWKERRRRRRNKKWEIWREQPHLTSPLSTYANPLRTPTLPPSQGIHRRRRATKNKQRKYKAHLSQVILRGPCLNGAGWEAWRTWSSQAYLSFLASLARSDRDQGKK